MPFIQRIDRKGLHNLQWAKPTPYVLRRDCFGVDERILYDGTVLRAAVGGRTSPPPWPSSAPATPRRRAASASPSTCCSPTSIRGTSSAWPSAVRRELPDVPVSISSEVAPIWREYERGNTVIVDAYLRRLIGEFAVSLQGGLEDLGMRSRCFFLKSNGGQVAAEAVTRQPVNLILSGLAGGLIAGKHFADATGSPDVFTLDMGGTSADVGVITGGRVRSRAQYEFEWGLPIAVPTVDLSTIGAGGSSIAGFDSGGFLKVGPESAGADPGPAAYGKGGDGRHRHRRQPRARPPQPRLLPGRRARAAPATWRERPSSRSPSRLGAVAGGRRAGDRRARDGEHGRRGAPAGGGSRPRLPPLRARRVRRRRPAARADDRPPRRPDEGRHPAAARASGLPSARWPATCGSTVT